MEQQSKLVRIGLNYFFPAGKVGLVVQSELIPPALGTALASCTNFKTIEQHCRDFMAGLSVSRKIEFNRELFNYYRANHEEFYLGSGMFEKMLISVFESFEKKGWFVSKTDVAGWTAEASTDGAQKIGTVGFVTRNRVSSLEGSLLSYVRNAKQHGRDVDFVICDDSPSPEVRRNYREVAKKMSREEGAKIWYAGEDEKKRFADRLAGDFSIPRDVLEFGLFDPEGCGMTCGANRNALTLHSAGDLVFSADDDTFCQLARRSDYKPGARVVVEGESRVTCDFFPDRESVVQSGTPVDVDHLGLHERYIGKTLGECVLNEFSEGDFDLTNLNAQQLHQMRRNKAKVVITFNGIYGDSGSNDPSFLFFAPKAQKDILLKSRETFDTAFATREVFKSSPNEAVGRATMCMSTAFGMDNRKVIPPFYPVYRNSDMLFGIMIASGSWGSYYGYLPESVLHAPPEKRKYNGTETTTRIWSQFWPEEAVQKVLSTFSLRPSAQGLPEGLVLMGQHIQSFGAMPFDEYREFLRDMISAERGSLVMRYEETLARNAKAPSYWKEKVQASLTQLQEKLKQPIILAPTPLIETLGIEGAERKVQQMVFRFGELATWWPKALEASRTLRASGIRLASNVSESRDAFDPRPSYERSAPSLTV